MSTIDKNGMLISPKVTLWRYPHIEHGSLRVVHGIIIHQTDSPNVRSTFNAYGKGGNGAHFLIAKDGVIYQTASLSKRCYHVGRRIKSKCLEINKNQCKDKKLAKLKAYSWSKRLVAIDKHERQKNYPDRFPINSDSIGIELVGMHINDKTYEPVTACQNMSLQWLIGELYTHFGLDKSDIYRHPAVSYKNPGEAASAKWK
ncbi:peptidoglycan recognition protein family protein [Candidatus Thiosymbion oneisti]|uniref:peptidoglycan recognition protein family protein n=1 Tax=Candidatus Thiosymbion oneisti TaxID=589554 RepID=UPI000AB27FBE|nr:peptidoglycan recognition family protein [Candidatus Thiosymbion oneisti]